MKPEPKKVVIYVNDGSDVRHIQFDAELFGVRDAIEFLKSFLPEETLTEESDRPLPDTVAMLRES